MVVEYQKEERLAVITLNRPEARNAVNGDVAQGMEEALDQYEADPELWAAILTANGKDLATPADLQKIVADAEQAGKEDVVMLVGFCNREFCGERTLLLPVKIK